MAQVQTGETITAKPDGWRPIIKIIESHKNRVPSDNLYSDYRKPSLLLPADRLQGDRRKNHAATASRLVPLFHPDMIALLAVSPAILGGELTTPRRP